MEGIREFFARFNGHGDWVAIVGGISLLTLVISALVVPILIRRLPQDYFVREHASSSPELERHPALRLLLLILKNLFGAILAIAGLIMFVTPGQGILTLLIGICLLDFPGKRRLEVWIVKRRPVHRAIDWIRRRAGEPPLLLPGD
jgi:hypothetical protein